jgi:hypothetical protein
MHLIAHLIAVTAPRTEARKQVGCSRRLEQ